MSLKRFQVLLDRCGDDPAAWPAGDRDLALELLEKSPEARAVLAEARRLKDLARGSTVKAPPGLAGRIVDKALKSDPAVSSGKLPGADPAANGPRQKR
jgi:hypothetical protein